MEDILKPKQQSKEDNPNESKGEAIQMIVFRQGKEEYGLHISQIKEVVQTPPVTPLPQTPPYIRGVANVRGNVFAMVDLQAKLTGNPPSGEIEEYRYSLVVSNEHIQMGILVKELPNTLTVYESELGDRGSLFQDSTDHTYIKGIVKLPKRLLLYLDIMQVMETKKESSEV